MKVGDYIYIPSDFVCDITDDYTLYIGANQDRNSRKLFARLSQENQNYFVTLYQDIFFKSKYSVIEMIDYNRFTYTIEYEKLYELTSKINFLEKNLPFYIENKLLYNKKHLPFCNISLEFAGRIIKYNYFFVVSPDSCILWHPRTSLTIIFKDEVVVLQTLSYPPPYSKDVKTRFLESPYNLPFAKVILMEDILFRDFKVDQSFIKKLKQFNTLEETVNFVKRELTMTVI
jgi:hypothetical protein